MAIKGPTKPKTEINKAYEEINTKNTVEIVSPKDVEVQKAHALRVKAAVEANTITEVLQGFTALNLEVSETLTKVQNRVQIEYARLQDIQDAITLAKAELETIHGMDVAQTSLDLLIAEHEQQMTDIDCDRLMRCRDTGLLRF